MKCLIVLVGESFRLGGQNSRNIGSDESFHGQMEASHSHLEFVNAIKSKFGMSSDILLNTYTTKFDAQLVKKYSENDLGGGALRTNFNPSQMGRQEIFNQSCELVADKLHDVEFVQFIRVDLILKRTLMDLFYPDCDRVLWPSACFFGWHKHDGCPRVSDTMLYVPKKHFSLIENKEIWFGHEGWSRLKHKIGSQNQGLLLGTLHDSDSAKDWNPIYWISGRPRNQIWASCNYRIDEDLAISRVNMGKWEVCDRLN